MADCIGHCHVANGITTTTIVAANRRRKVQQRRSSTRSNRKHTLAPLAAAIRSMCDLGAQLTASWISAVCWFLLRGENRRTQRKTLEAEKRTNTKSTHLWRRVRESNPGHIDRRRVLSPLRHPCFPRLRLSFEFSSLHVIERRRNR